MLINTRSQVRWLRRAVLTLLPAAVLSSPLAASAGAQTQAWATRYDSGSVPALLASPQGRHSAVVDGAGNAYVTGSLSRGVDSDCLTVKFDPSGQVVWSAQLTFGNCYAIVLDGAGGVYVTGFTRTVKYDASTGAEQWAVPSSGTALVWSGSGLVVMGSAFVEKRDASGAQQWYAGSSSVLRALAVDVAGNIYAAGSSGSPSDMATSKYSSSGALVWSRTFGGTANGADVATSIGVDGAGNVCVTGTSRGANSDLQTLQYDAAGGLRWAAAYDSGGDDQGADLAMDGAGSCYVTGQAYTATYDAVTIKYLSTGEPDWTRVFDAGDSDHGSAIALDTSGNVYVAGRSFLGSGYDFRTIKYGANGVQQWTVAYNGPSARADWVYGLALDGAGNPLLLGYSDALALPGSSHRSYRLVKYDAAGAQAWTATQPAATVNGTDSPVPLDSLAVDAGGNTYVLAFAFNGKDRDFLTVKHDPFGSVLWARRFDSGGNDMPSALALDPTGGVCVTGTAFGADQDYLTIKYDEAGTEQWAALYDGGAGELARAIAIDASGNVYVTGGVSSGVFRTVKYDAAGTQQWVAGGDAVATNGSAAAMTLDSNGNIYVTGASSTGGRTLKHGPDGSLLWSVTYGGGSSDGARAVALDALGDVYVMGARVQAASGTDFLLAKYSAAGVEQWVRTYTSSGVDSDRAVAMAVDPAGHAYVTGTVATPTGDDWVTLKYDGSGALLWVTPYNGPTNSYDATADLALDPAGGVYVTGYTDSGLATATDYLTIKYDGAGVAQWAATFAGPGSLGQGLDLPASIAVNSIGNVYVTGVSDGLSGADIATVKYVRDSTTPSNPTSLASTTHQPLVWSSLGQIAMGWAGAADDPGGAGLAGYSVVFDTSAGTSPDASLDVPHSADPHSTSSSALLDGINHYFHLRTCDLVPNCASAVHAGPYWIDGTLPLAPPSVASGSHTVGVPSVDRTIDIAWTAASDPPSNGVAAGIDGYSYFFDGNATADCDLTKDVAEGTVAGTSPALGNGSWYAHVCARDNAGNWSPVTFAGPYLIDNPDLADLALTLTDAPDPIPVYGSVTYTASYENAGPAAANSVTLNLTLPAGLTFVSSVPGAPTCVESAGLVGCELGSLAVSGNGSITVTANADPGTLGSVTASVSISAAENDPTSANNSEGENTQVKFRKGDLQNDLSTDLFLANTQTHEHRVWLMVGTTQLVEQAFDPPVPAAATQQVVGVDDFDGDHRNDLVFWNSATGAVEFWLMNGTERLGAPVPMTGGGPLAPNWRLAATADFNADGWPDLVWRNTTSQKLVVWTMNGTTKLGGIVPTPDQAAHANWDVVGAFDMNGDSAIDFLWYNATTGKIVYWWMNASLVRITGNFTNPANAGDNNWKVMAAGDYGVGPGGVGETTDIVWRNATSGRHVVWHLDLAGNRTAGTFTTPMQPAVNPTEWMIVGPR